MLGMVSKTVGSCYLLYACATDASLDIGNCCQAIDRKERRSMPNKNADCCLTHNNKITTSGEHRRSALADEFLAVGSLVECCFAWREKEKK